MLHGGFGTRLRPLTHTGPKQMIKVAGKPVSQWALEDLRDSGVKNIAVILGTLAPERVVDYYGNGRWLGLKITYIYQGYPFGLAHAVYTAKDFVGDEPFVVYLGDNVILSGISRFVDEFLEKDYDAYVLFAQIERPERFGVGVFDEKGRLIGLVEKPKVPPSPYALVGVYFFRPPYIFRAVEELKPSWRGELEITDAIQKLINWGLKIGHGFVDGWWKDTGTPKDILEANRMLLDAKIKYTIKGYLEDGAVVEGRVFVDKGAKIESGAVVRGPAYIGEGTIVGSGTYVGPYTSIGSQCTLRNIEIENSIVQDHIELINIKNRIVDSLIGSYVSVRKGEGIPKGIRLVIGERSKLLV